MDEVVIRPLTIRDIDKMYPEGRRDTCQGWAIDLNGELAGVAGVSNTGSMFLAFSNFTPEALSANRRLVVKTAFVLWEKIKALGYKELYADADKSLPNAPCFLTMLGFEHIESSARGERFRWLS